MSEDATGFSLPKWFWFLGAGLALGVVTLFVLWYIRHPDRSPFEDFARRGPLGVPESNGAVPHPPTSVSTVADGGQEGSETAA